MKKLALEALEERRLLTVVLGGSNYDPPPLGEEVGYVAPADPALAPIALPAGIVPPGTAELPPPEGGEPPDGLTSFSNLSESFATTLAVGFMYAHPDSMGDVTAVTGSGTFTVTIDLHDGTDFFSYGVDESSAEIAAQYVMRDGAHSEILSSFELTGPLDGGLVYAQFDNDQLTELAVHSEIAGATTLWTWGGSGGGNPGLALPAGYAALDALVAAHLDGPAAGAALDTFHAAADEYYTLVGAGPVLADFNHDNQIDAADYVVWRRTGGSAGDFNLWRAHFGESIPAGSAAGTGAVPEPGSLLLAAAALPLVMGGRRRTPSAAGRQCQ
jgi:hypothetical protein